MIDRQCGIGDCVYHIQQTGIDDVAIHEIRKINRKPSPFRVPIRQNPRIHQRPAESIGYDDDDSLWCSTIRRFSHICCEAMDCFHSASRRSFVQGSGHAVFAGHGSCHNGQCFWV